MNTMYDSLVWHEVQVTAHAAAKYIPLVYGEVGTEGKRITLIAGTHGDEGPGPHWLSKPCLRTHLTN